MSAWLLPLLALSASPSESERAAPTYHRDVAPILQRHCQECHRPGQVAPFSLMTYEQARKRAGDLAARSRAGPVTALPEN